ncbi:PAS domain-containing sensor histidine kinase [Halalkalibacter akibai]|uniref:histidine kinase n=1 Tax=Halalkalibacter akibai (strain ATCC 43226 / DSM 21942 / CIP 109018 / JCM 9157 / 1139) TaxID=1236973 RepID=W4QZR5_HALA3|nr:PAS domain-containing sensor histidine kinase [Halalkalibacter akibai]GAE36804.1 two-component sensor histidine kinase [Halalkalibacter akibai JCM 9157]
MNISEKEILDRISDAFYALDEHWNFTYFNKEASRLLLRDQGKLIGKNIWSEFPETIETSLFEKYHKALKVQLPLQFDLYYDPLKIWFEIRVYPSQNGLSVYFKDITKEKEQASRQEQHYRSLFDYNPDAVYSLDLEGNYLSVNSTTEQLLGYSEKELIQMSYIPLITEDEMEKTTAHFSKAVNGCIQHYESKVTHKEGHIVDIKVTNIPIIVENKIVGVYGIAKDVSNQKRTEKLLFESEKLTAVGQLAASIAHEIRNPLTSIKGFLQLIKGTNEKVNKNYLNIMADEITRIEMITGELLLLAKPQAHDFQYEYLNKIVEDVVLLLSSQALINHVEVNVTINRVPLMKCVPNQLKQVFINLIKNAIEAMPTGGVITIHASQQQDTSIRIVIEDEGGGIPQEFLDKIGTPFYTTKEKGTGLGLMTTLKIIDFHHGTLNISSVINKGTKIEIILPLEQTTTLKGNLSK